jgi:hypothetical protein
MTDIIDEVFIPNWKRRTKKISWIISYSLNSADSNSTVGVLIFINVFFFTISTNYEYIFKLLFFVFRIRKKEAIYV